MVSSSSSRANNRTPLAAHRHNSKDRVASYAARANGVSREEREDLIPALALRSYHLPGYGACRDWWQYMANNHPVLSIFCHHRLHPVRVGMRLVNLVGSIGFGLLVTNIIWLWFILNEIDQDEAVVTLSVNGMFRPVVNTTIAAATSGSEMASNGGAAAITADDVASATTMSEVSITRGMLYLWTIGGGLHALFDNIIYFITACPCCLPGQSLENLRRYQKCSNYLVVWTVVLITALATFVVVLRAALEEDESALATASAYVGGNSTDADVADEQGADLDLQQVGLEQAPSAAAYDFLISYSIELSLALFLYYPLVGTLLFSGVLGCGKIPLLGGRPYEVRQEKLNRRRKVPNSQSRSIGTPHTSSAISINDV